MLPRLCALLVLVAGCDLYWNPNGSGDDNCDPGPNEPAIELRNPDTGQCQSFGGGHCGCGAPCVGGVDVPAWPVCHGTCDQLAESDCLATPGCHAAYQTFVPGVGSGSSSSTPEFMGCWNVEESAPSQGVCEGLDADSCTGRDDCVGLYDPNTTTAPESWKFDRCEPEAGGLCQADGDCLFGQTCDTTTCHAEPDPSTAGCGECPPACFGVCSAALPPPPPPMVRCSALTTEADCTARTDCEAVYNGSGCTCDASGCTCTTETFAYCEPR